MLTEELRIECADIETYKSMFNYCGYDPSTNEKFLFEVSHRTNQVDGLVKHLLEYQRDYLVTFNGVGFDGQVLQFIIDTSHKWYDFTWRQVVDAIYNFAQDLISNQDYGLQPPYKEQFMDFKQIDLFLVLHYNNQARRTGLKWAAEFSLDGDIEELPIDFRKQELSSKEIDDIIEYCWNDVTATYNLYKVCIGDTTHPDYKGKNKIQLRLDLINEYELNHTAINWNDVKIGAELNKKEYIELAKITQNQLWDKVKNRKTRTGFTFKDCFPKYAKFDTKEFKNFFKKVGATKVNLNDKQEFPFTYNGTTYKFAKGGGHSDDPARVLHSDNEWMIYDGDVGLK